MSMIAVFRQISPVELQAFIARPEDAYGLILGAPTSPQAFLAKAQAIESKYADTGLFERGRSGKMTDSDLELMARRNQDLYSLVGQIRPGFEQAQREQHALERKLKDAGIFEEVRAGFRGKPVAPKHREAFEQYRKAFNKTMHLLRPGMKVFGDDDRGDSNILNIEKSWHGLHFLLTGVAEGGKPPLANAILGGHELPDRDARMGYGPIRYLKTDEVRAVAAALSRIKEASLQSRFDVTAMKKHAIYAIRGKADLEYLQQHFSELKKFYADAAKRQNATLSYLQ